MNTFLRFVDGAEHYGIYGRRPIADEPPARLAMLPPTALIFGEKDWLLTPSVDEAVTKFPPGSSLHIEPYVGHQFHIARPDLFNRLVAAACSSDAIWAA